MPHIEVQIPQERLSNEVSREIAEGVTDVMSEVLGKQRELVAVAVRPVDGRHWYIANTSVDQEPFRTTAFVNARITEQTNSEAEKAEAIEKIQLLLTRVLGPLCEASYIVIGELPATDWGYGGRTPLSRKPEVKRLENGAVDTRFYQERGRKVRSARMRFVLLSFARRVKTVFTRRVDALVPEGSVKSG